MTDPSRRAVAAHREMRAVLALRAVLAVLGAIVLVVAAVGLAGAGIVDHTFPPYIPGGSSTVIAAYSGARLAGAIGVGTVAGLLLVSAVTDIWRRTLMGTSLARCRTGFGQVDRLVPAVPSGAVSAAGAIASPAAGQTESTGSVEEAK